MRLPRLQNPATRAFVVDNSIVQVKRGEFALVLLQTDPGTVIGLEVHVDRDGTPAVFIAERDRDIVHAFEDLEP